MASSPRDHLDQDDHGCDEDSKSEDSEVANVTESARLYDYERDEDERPTPVMGTSNRGRGRLSSAAPTKLVTVPSQDQVPLAQVTLRPETSKESVTSSLGRNTDHTTRSNHTMTSLGSVENSSESDLSVALMSVHLQDNNVEPPNIAASVGHQSNSSMRSRSLDSMSLQSRRRPSPARSKSDGSMMSIPSSGMTRRTSQHAPRPVLSPLKIQFQTVLAKYCSATQDNNTLSVALDLLVNSNWSPLKDACQDCSIPHKVSVFIS